MAATPQDEGMEEHLALCEQFEHALCFDQVNIGELASFELAGRRIQMWEFVYEEKLRTATNPGSTGAFEERSLFTGTDAGRGASLVCPALRDWITGQLRDPSGILKERHKAREERESLADGTVSRKRTKPKGKAKAGDKG